MEENRSTRTPWIAVTAIILAAVLMGIALIVGNEAFIVVAVVVVVASAAAAAVLTRRGGGPISFTEEFPAHTVGPRATTDGISAPPINTQKHPDPIPPNAVVRVVEASDSPDPPDDERVFPQYVNLAPDERLRQTHGRTYIEKRQTAIREDADEAP